MLLYIFPHFMNQKSDEEEGNAAAFSDNEEAEENNSAKLDSENEEEQHEVVAKSRKRALRSSESPGITTRSLRIRKR